MIISNTSRYRKSVQFHPIANDPDEVLILDEDIIITVDPSDTEHVVTNDEVGRLDKISYKYYRNPLLWWVIAKANNIENPMEDVVLGTRLLIPSTTQIFGKGGALSEW